MKLKLILSASIMMSLLFFTGCAEDEPADPVFAAPTISIAPPTSLEVLVGGTLAFTVTVEAEAGLSTVNLDGMAIKTYAGSETTDSFMYEYSSSENGTPTLTFSVQDADGVSVDAEGVVVSVVGDLGFLIADFAGDQISSSTLGATNPDHWDASRPVIKFDITSQLGTSATHENAGAQFTIETGVENPDADAGLIYQGKTMKVVKNPAGWGTPGWSHIMFDFEQTLDQAIVEALPQLNAENTGLTTGTKFAEIDVYYQDSDALPFADMIGSDVTVGDNPAFGSDKTKGYSFFLMFTKHEDHRLNPDGSGMYIGYEEYLTEANVWTTIRFDELYLESAGNFFGSGNEDAATSDVIDGVKIVAGGGYGDGQSENAIYFRNLRIIDVQ